MPATTAWERHTRRRDVIRLRFGKRYTAEEISEELGWSEATICRDLDQIRKQTAQMGEPQVIREQIFGSITHLLSHEFDDLRDADKANDEQAKHRAKASFRQTLQMLVDVHKEICHESPSGDEQIRELPEQAQEVLAEVAKDEIEKTLSDRKA